METAPPTPAVPRRSAVAVEESTSDVGRFIAGLLGWLLGKRGAMADCPVTRLLIIANAVVFIAEVVVARSFNALVAIPEPVMLAFGGNYAPFVVGEGRVELLVTSCFLHFSALHAGFNLYALRQVGPFVERAVGPARFLPMYLLSGIVGSAASTLMGFLGNPERLSAGASGAICGAIGAALVLAGRTQGWRGPIVRAMGFWLLATFVLGISIGADNSAHAGGAVTGALTALIWKRGVVYRPFVKRLILAVCALIIAGSGVTVMVRYATDPYAALDVEGRRMRAIELYNSGDCEGATTAIQRATRLAPRGERAERLAVVRDHIARYCPNAS